VAGQDDDEDVTQELMAHPEVLGVHVQLVTVEFAQLGKRFLDAVQVLDGLPKGGQHLLAMGTDHGVAQDGRGAGQVPKGGKEPLGPGVDNQQHGSSPPGTPGSVPSVPSTDTSPSCPGSPARGFALGIVGSQAALVMRDLKARPCHPCHGRDTF
uniref:Uncharacterized protein n=1 Tax=Ficedula albicollis TaxID=59894 RepID=A0A803VVV2_FICAL